MCIYIYIYIHMYTHMCVYMYIHIYVYTCMHTYRPTFTPTKPTVIRARTLKSYTLMLLYTGMNTLIP